MHALSVHVVELLLRAVPQADRTDRSDEGELGESAELGAVREPRPPVLVGEVGVRVEVHDVERSDRLHPTSDREADRVVAAHRDDERPALRHPTDHVGDPGQVAVRIGARDGHVPDVGHGDPA